jgi:transcription initiation factor TFIIH subunit 1
MRLDKKAGESALMAMTQNVSNRLNMRSRKSTVFFQSSIRNNAHPCICIDDIPGEVFKQVIALQTAANEFLRQFWTAIYPPAVELKTVGASTPVIRQAKAAKMASYLSKFEEKVDGLAISASKQNIDGERVRVVNQLLFVPFAQVLMLPVRRRL